MLHFKILSGPKRLLLHQHAGTGSTLIYFHSSPPFPVPQCFLGLAKAAHTTEDTRSLSRIVVRFLHSFTVVEKVI